MAHPVYMTGLGCWYRWRLPDWDPLYSQQQGNRWYQSYV